ncbi:RAB8A [Dirofilaria immitis]|nr:RAB8A [Dirofilaria immitis]
MCVLVVPLVIGRGSVSLLISINRDNWLILMAKSYDYLFKELLKYFTSNASIIALDLKYQKLTLNNSNDYFSLEILVSERRVYCFDFRTTHSIIHSSPPSVNYSDTAGQERFRTITTAYYRGAMGIMLVYDITNEKSFDNIKNWIRNIEEHASSDVDRMIIGNKCDVEERRQVSRERGEQLAIEYGTKFMETSAKANINVEEAFFTLARDIKLKTERTSQQNTTQNTGRITVHQMPRKSPSLFSGWRCSLV